MKSFSVRFTGIVLLLLLGFFFARNAFVIPVMAAQGLQDYRGGGQAAAATEFCQPVAQQAGDLVLSVARFVTGISTRELVEAFVTVTVVGITNILCEIYHLGDRINGQVVFQTGDDLTVNQPLVNILRSSLEVLAAGALAIAIVVAGLRTMRGKEVPMEALERIGLSAVAIYGVHQFLPLLIDLHNQMCLQVLRAGAIEVGSEIAQQFTRDVVSTLNTLGLVFAAFLIIYIAVMVQMLVRIALLNILIILSPVAMLCYADPSWQRWATLWTASFIATLFVQFLQITAMVLGVALIGTLQIGGLLNVLVGIAVLFLVLKIPGWLGNAVASTLGGVPSTWRLAKEAAQQVMGIVKVVAALA